MNLLDLVNLEKEKQENCIQLIASENFVSQEILDLQGSILTNKYAEGYPNKRYYGGCEHVDKIETLAQNECLKMFDAEDDYHANVQPHSGSQSNQAVYLAVLKPNDVVLGMDLFHGGHLTHGYKLSVSGILYDFHSYYTKDGVIDYENLTFQLSELKPKLIVVGASAYPFKIDFKKIYEIVSSTSPETLIMADIAHIAGLIVAKQHPSPFGYADFITSTTHKTLRGPRGGIILCKNEHKAIIDRAVFPGIQGGPLMHVIAAKAQCFIQNQKQDYKDYIKQVVTNSKIFSDTLNELGLKTSNTENHLILVDVYSSLNMTGSEAEKLLEEHNIIVNKNTLPNDPLSAFNPSGIRIGTPAMTTRGYKENDFIKLANTMHSILTK